MLVKYKFKGGVKYYPGAMLSRSYFATARHNLHMAGIKPSAQDLSSIIVDVFGHGESLGDAKVHYVESVGLFDEGLDLIIFKLFIPSNYPINNQIFGRFTGLLVAADSLSPSNEAIHIKCSPEVKGFDGYSHQVTVQVSETGSISGYSGSPFLMDGRLVGIVVGQSERHASILKLCLLDTCIPTLTSLSLDTFNYIININENFESSPTTDLIFELIRRRGSKYLHPQRRFLGEARSIIYITSGSNSKLAQYLDRKVRSIPKDILNITGSLSEFNRIIPDPKFVVKEVNSSQLVNLVPDYSIPSYISVGAIRTVVRPGKSSFSNTEEWSDVISKEASHTVDITYGEELSSEKPETVFSAIYQSQNSSLNHNADQIYSAMLIQYIDIAIFYNYSILGYFYEERNGESFSVDKYEFMNTISDKPIIYFTNTQNQKYNALSNSRYLFDCTSNEGINGKWVINPIKFEQHLNRFIQFIIAKRGISEIEIELIRSGIGASERQKRSLLTLFGGNILKINRKAVHSVNEIPLILRVSHFLKISFV